MTESRQPRSKRARSKASVSPFRGQENQERWRKASVNSNFSAALGLLLALMSPAVGQGTASPGTQPFLPDEFVAKDGIATIPAPLTSQPGDPAAGEKVVIDRRLGNCLSCHEISTLGCQQFHGEIGPPLVGAGARWDPAMLRMIVVNPKKVFGPETVLPAFFRIDGLNRVRPEFAGKPILTAQQVEDVVAYLATLK